MAVEAQFVTGSAKQAILIFLQYAKKIMGGAAPPDGLIPGFEVSVHFKNLSQGKLNLLIPQNVVATRPTDILHIENFGCSPF
jgi:hypothetical protein